MLGAIKSSQSRDKVCTFCNIDLLILWQIDRFRVHCTDAPDRSDRNQSFAAYDQIMPCIIAMGRLNLNNDRNRLPQVDVYLNDECTINMFDWIIDGIGWIVRVFLYNLVGALIEKIFYWPGWLLFRLITYGRYPPEAGVKHNRFAVGLFALTVTALASVLYVQFAR